MKIKKLIKITDLNGEFVFELDFQDTPNDYRIKRVDQLMKKYPKDDYVWDGVFEDDEMGRPSGLKDSEILLTAVQAAYRKHVLQDESIGWDELGDILLNALANVMSEDGYSKWRKQLI